MSGTPRATRPAETVAVLICSYRRPESLLPCLAALAAQTRLPDEVLVVARPDDTPTIAAVQGRADDGLRVRLVPVDTPGLVAARNAGLAANHCDAIAFCDDDTCAHPDWVARVLQHFRDDPTLGGLGGRDHCHDGTRFDTGRHATVGRVHWYGRIVGNHHLGYGAARVVHFLKGANMSYRADAIRNLRFDPHLRGKGGQPHDDLAFSLAVGRAGWKLVYDPAVALDHYAFRRDEPRAYVAGGGLPDPQGYHDSVYNYVLAVWKSLPPMRRLTFAAWSLLIGMRVYPGILQLVRVLPREGKVGWRKFILCQRASLEAYAFLRSQQKPLRIVLNERAEGS
jgi:GT2 family glycosyltransferase